MRKIAIALVTTALTVPCSGRASEPDLKPLFESLFAQMAGTYSCRHELGGTGQYQAARTAAISAISTYVGHDQAVLWVDQMDKKFKDDPRTKSPLPGATIGFCMELINEGWHKIDVEKAKLSQREK
jgi:hypothetical protein